MIQRVSLSKAELKEYGRKVKEKRLSLDWKVERLAHEINRCVRTVHIIESGSRPVCRRTMLQIYRIWPDLKEKNATTL